MHPRALRWLFAGGLFLSVLPSSRAATSISGNQSGTLFLTNSPYLVTGHLVVPNGQTLTIQPGVVLQFQNPDVGMFVDGTLIARGTSASPILFTSDEANKQRGQWLVLSFRSTTGTNTVLESCIVECAGGPGFTENIVLDNTSAPLITNCISRTSGGNGITFLFSDAHVQNCTFSNNANFAISMRADSVPTLRNNSASGNGKDAIGIFGFSVSRSGTWMRDNIPYTVVDTAFVFGGVTLTIEPGTTVQFQDPDDGFIVDGTLIARGTPASPILFTSDETTKQGAQWQVVWFRGTTGANTIMENCIVECAGGPGFNENICIEGTSAPLITNCVSRTSGRHGLTFLFSDARVQNCVFSNNADFAMSMRADSLPVIRNNSASGNGKNAIGIFGFNVNRSGTWVRDNIPYTAIDTVVVLGGVTLTIEPGTIVQFQDVDDGMFVDGTLIARGTTNSPILFTSNKANKQPAQWQVLSFRGTAGTNTVLENCVIECAGGLGSTENVRFETTSAPVLTNCIIRTGSGHGINIFGSDARVQNCTFSNNLETAMTVRMDSFPVLRNNAAMSNGKNVIGLYGFNVSRSGTWTRDNIPYTAFDSVVVNATATLTIEPGTTVQFQDPEDGMFIEGTLIARGTSNSPIIFTSDDAAKQPAQWQVLSFRQPAGTNTILENCVIECAGAAPSAENIRFENTSAPLVTNCTIRLSGGHGANFFFSDARMENCRFHTNRLFAVAMRADSFPRLGNNSASGNTNDAIAVYGFNVNRSGTWAKDNLPYTAVETVVINPGFTLTLTPGLIIQFRDPDDGFFIDGRIIANGTTANPILFTSDNAVKQAGQWHQVVFHDSSDDTNSVFNNCIIEYAGALAEGSLSFFAASPRISNVTIRNSTNDGIYCNFSSPQIMSCRILNSGRDGIRTVNGSSPVVANCVISGSVGFGANNFDTSRIIKAENNYWGHPSGPLDNSNADGQALLNPNGLGERVSEYVDWIPFTGSDPTGGGPQGPDIDLSTTNLSFGNVPVGRTNQMTLVIYNVGNSNLTVTSLTSDNPQFTFVAPLTPFGVAAQQLITVRFAPTTSGSQTGRISITSNDPDEPLVNVTVSGTSIEPDIALSATNLNFGSVTLGQSNTLTLTVSNVGTSALTVTSLTTNNPVFRVISPATPFNVATGAQAVVTLRFSPTTAGAQSGNLSITSNDPDEATVAVALTGTGVTSGQTNLCVAVTNGLVSWWRAENSAADSQGTNHGVLRNGATFAPGKVGQGFSFSGVSSHVEAPMGEMSVGIGDFTVEGWIMVSASSFQPGFSTIISFGGVAIYLRDDGAGNARLDLWPAGSAGGGTGFADGQFHHFSVVRQGTANNNITYYKDGANIGTAGNAFPLNTNKCSIGWDYVNQNYPFTGIIDELSFYKRALSAAEIQAIANADSAGKCAGGGGGGTNNAPDIALSATSLNFGAVNLGASNELTLTVSNVGASALSITSLATNNPAFRIVSPATPLNIAARTQAVVTIRFTPVSSGVSTGALSIASNDPDEANVIVDLTGSGLTGPPIITSITPSNAPSGSIVTISGANFGNNASELLVAFGNHLGVVQSVTATQIVVRLPLIVSGSVSVVVTRGGQSSNPFTLQVQSTPSSLRITDVSLTATDSVRLLTQPVWPVPEQLLLESAGSPLGPWWKDPDFQRNNVAGGQEFLTPRRPYYAQRYFRVGAFANQALPFIAYISPNEYVARGQSVTLLGANFSPVPSQNIVRFELPSQSWIATVTAAATNYLVVTVPANLFATNTGSGFLYRVKVTTAQGTGNGVGCSVYSQNFVDSFVIRPDQAYVIQPPGTGMETLVVGGGVPPYQLVPQSSNDLTVAVATLNGPILKVVARTNVSFRSITVRIQDSSAPPREASADVSVIAPTFAPPFSAAFHTLLAGTAPGLTMTTEFYGLQPEQLELRLQNVQIELDQLAPGSLLGLIRLFYSSSAYDFQRMVVTDVSPGRVAFDMLAVEDENLVTNAHGELIQNPPTMVINALNQSAGAIMPTTVDQEMMIADGVFRLPAAPGESFSTIANFTSVSANENQYLPLRNSVTNKFTTTGVVTGAPRIERVLPVHGEIGRNIRLRGTGFDPNPTNNLVTFNGPFGLRVPADIVLQTNDEIFVTVPAEAITGPVRLSVGGKTGNDFSFFVRFHPGMDVNFTDFTANTPTALQFFHQQPIDDGETIGEVPIQTVITTIDQGRLALSGVNSNQQVGTLIIANFYDGGKSTNVLVYKGQETITPQRHRFEVLASTNSSSSHALARLYAADDADGSGVTFQNEAGLVPFNAGIGWDYQFSTPIYRPPATAGADVTVRLEAISQQWTAIARSEMRVIQTSTQRVK